MITKFGDFINEASEWSNNKIVIKDEKNPLFHLIVNLDDRGYVTSVDNPYHIKNLIFQPHLAKPNKAEVLNWINRYNATYPDQYCVLYLEQ